MDFDSNGFILFEPRKHAGEWEAEEAGNAMIIKDDAGSIGGYIALLFMDKRLRGADGEERAIADLVVEGETILLNIPSRIALTGLIGAIFSHKLPRFGGTEKAEVNNIEDYRSTGKVLPPIH